MKSRLSLAHLLLVLAVSLVGSLLLANRGATEEPPLGRFAAVAPDLVLDTATGRLTDSKGAVVNPPINASGTQVGRYSAAGYVATVVRRVSVDFMSQGHPQTEVVKGFTLVDTTTGHALKSQAYSRKPLSPQEF